jgi:hypothetical protein
MTAVQEWTHTDKSEWGAGPWQHEPDKLQWVDEATGLDCLMVRNHGGNWCGYVGVAEGHPWFGVGYAECAKPCGEDWCTHSPDSHVEVHGGLTYAAFCQEDAEPGHGICHIAAPDRPERVWWFGFDCGHYRDLSPADFMYRRKYGITYDADAVYRDRAYVEREVMSLARQLAAVTP